MLALKARLTGAAPRRGCTSWQSLGKASGGSSSTVPALSSTAHCLHPSCVVAAMGREDRVDSDGFMPTPLNP